MNRLSLTFVLAGLLGMALVVPAPPVFAQQLPSLLTSQRQPVEITTGGYYQQYDTEAGTIKLVSAPLRIAAPLGKRTRFRLGIAYAAVSGDGESSISGVNDLTASISHAVPMGLRSSLVLSLSTRLPTGKVALEQADFGTAQEMSLNKYGFYVPVFGRGLGVSPSLIFAFQVNDKVVLGLGATYHFKAAYEPVATITDFDPGDEVLLTTGLDVLLDRLNTFSMDVTLVLYGTDTLNEADLFTAGPKISALAQYRRRGSGNDLRLWARFRNHTDSETLAGGFFAPAPERTPPQVIEAHIRYQARLSPTFWTTLNAGVRNFGDTPSPEFEAETLVLLGIQPQVRLSPEVSFDARFEYVLGSTTGFNTGLGLTARL